MSNSPSPPGSDLVIDDEDLDIDSMEVTMEDLTKAEVECGVGVAEGKVLARPAVFPHVHHPITNIAAVQSLNHTTPIHPLTAQFQPAITPFKFGATRTNTSETPATSKARISSADPRTKFKPSGFLSLNPGDSDLAPTFNNSMNSFDANHNLKKTLNITAGSSILGKQVKKLPTEHTRNKFMFGSCSPTTAEPGPSKVALESSISPPCSSTSVGNADSQGEDLPMPKFILRKQEHEAKMREEQNKIEQIEKLLEQKKKQQRNIMPGDPHINAQKMALVNQELELKKQTTRMLEMQQNMLVKNNEAAERRRLEEKKQMLELQVQVRNLEKLLTAKQAQEQNHERRGIGSYGKQPVRSRLGSKPQNNGAEDWRAARKRRLGEEQSEGFDEVMNEVIRSKKCKKYQTSKLPDDLVLTEITEQGPVRKEDVQDRDDDEGTKVADDLFAASIAADEDKWLQFQVEDGVPVRHQLGKLKRWLGENRPSNVTRSSGVGWIAVKFRDRGRKVLEAKIAWDAFQGNKNMEVVNNLAEKFGVNGGKWLCHLSTDKIDEVWGKLATAMICGELGSSVYMVKVSPRQDVQGVSKEQSKGDHVICVYNTDYRDTRQVMKVESLMRTAGVASNLTYKPDIFSALGIYRNNEWGFRPTIYHSMVVDGRSKVVVVGTSKWYYNTSKGLEYPSNRKDSFKKKEGSKAKEGGQGNVMEYARTRKLNEGGDVQEEVKKSGIKDDLDLKAKETELSSTKHGQVPNQAEVEDYEEDLDRYEFGGDDLLLME